MKYLDPNCNQDLHFIFQLHLDLYLIQTEAGHERRCTITLPEGATTLT